MDGIVEGKTKMRGESAGGIRRWKARRSEGMAPVRGLAGSAATPARGAAHFFLDCAATHLVAKACRSDRRLMRSAPVMVRL